MLEHRTAILTGSNGGIGHCVAAHWLEHGANCILTDISAESEETSALIEKFGTARVVYQQSDITLQDSRAALIVLAKQHFKGLDLLFNNAAVFDMAPLLDSNESMYDKIFDVNVKGMFFMMTAAAAAMKESGGGAVINMASQAGRRGEALVSHYCASKAAVISYTQSAALALAGDKIRVNAISPGVIDTPMWSTVDGLFAQHENLQPGEKKRQVGQAVPWGRMGTPQDIAGAALFLASSSAGYITGQTLNVDGGNVLS